MDKFVSEFFTNHKHHQLFSHKRTTNIAQKSYFSKHRSTDNLPPQSDSDSAFGKSVVSPGGHSSQAPSSGVSWYQPCSQSTQPSLKSVNSWPNSQSAVTNNRENVSFEQDLILALFVFYCVLYSSFIDTNNYVIQGLWRSHMLLILVTVTDTVCSNFDLETGLRYTSLIQHNWLMNCWYFSTVQTCVNQRIQYNIVLLIYFTKKKAAQITNFKIFFKITV